MRKFILFDDCPPVWLIVPQGGLCESVTRVSAEASRALVALIRHRTRSLRGAWTWSIPWIGIPDSSRHGDFAFVLDGAGPLLEGERALVSVDQRARAGGLGQEFLEDFRTCVAQHTPFARVQGMMRGLYSEYCSLHTWPSGWDVCIVRA